MKVEIGESSNSPTPTAIMELKPPVTEISWRMATHAASVVINASQLSYVPQLLDAGVDVEPITFSGSESSERKWSATFYMFRDGLYANFLYAGSLYVVDGKAELTVGSSPPSSHACDAGVYTSGSSVLTINGVSLTSDCRISFAVTYLVQQVDREPRSLSRFGPKLDEDETLHIVYENLLSSAKYPDLSFVVGDQFVPAHKAILAARVPYFDKMLSSGMEEAETSRVKLDESIDVAAFKEVLKYIYGGHLPPMLDDDAFQILPIADQYDLARLKEACFFRMERSLTKENVCDTLILADLYRGANLKKECLKRLHQWGSSLESKFLEKLSEHPRLMIEFIQSK